MYHIHTTIKRYFLIHLILCSLVGLSASLQAATSADQSDVPKNYDYALQNRFDQGQSIQAEEKAPLPPNQCLIPANRQSLCTSVIIGYLFPVMQEAAKFTPRITQLFGDQPAGYLNELHQALQNPIHYLTYIHSDAFSTLLTAFIARMQFKKGAWGNPQEIQTIANKLKVNIQVHYPDPSNPTNLVTSDFVKSAQANADITIHIVQDNIRPAEVLTEKKTISAADNPPYQHYRIKHSLFPSVSSPLLPSQQPHTPHKMGLSQPCSAQWFKAAKTGNRKLLEELYHKYNINVHDRDEEGNTALLLSAQEEHLPCVKYLVEQGADIHDTNAYGNTPLIWSAFNGHVTCLRYLVEQGANIQDTNNVRNTALLYSAREGHVACVNYLVGQGADINHKNIYGHTALLLSVEGGHVACIRFFLTSVDVRKLNLQEIDFSKVTKLTQDLSRMNLTSAQLPKDLANHKLTHANLTGQRFISTNFEGTQLAGAILTNTLCDYQQCFQDHVKANGKKIEKWYLHNLPKDLKSIAKVYLRLSQDSHKAELLQIASGLAYLPYWKGKEFCIKVHYWSCRLLLLKKQLSSGLKKQLRCSLGDNKYGLNYDIENYCWQTNYPQHQVKEAPHNDFDQYLKTFQAGLQQYSCTSKYRLGYDYYKNNITKSIRGLLKTYPKLTDNHQALKKEVVDIAFQLSTLYQHQHLGFLLRYLSLQNRLIRLKKTTGKEIGDTIHYNYYSDGRARK